MAFTLLRASALLLLSAAACAPTEDAGPFGGDDGPIGVVDEEKADNYRSPFGQEYDLTGSIQIDLLGADDQSEAAAQAIASPLLNRLAVALDAELKRVWPEARRQAEKNIVVMLRTESNGIGQVQAVGEGIYSVSFYAEIGAPSDFLTSYPVRNENGTSYIDIAIDVNGAQQTVALEIAPSTASENSYPNYLEMFEDGLDIAIHVGGDYNEPRTDVSHARAIYDDLIAFGFQSPVASFDALDLTSGPLTSTLATPTNYTTVRVHLYHPEMVPDDRLSELSDAYRASARTADIVVYSGHAGTDTSYSGVVSHYNPRESITANAFATMDVPTKYQIFMFNGCETYTGYADQLYRNPNKTPQNLDVVTTVNFGWTGTSDQAFVRALLSTRNVGWYPRTWDSLLNELETHRGVSEPSTIYGVHGIDDNAKITPTADLSTIGMACTRETECPGVDNMCVTLAAGNSVCGAACTSDSGCPEGNTCIPITGVGAEFGNVRHCLPSR